MYTIYAFGVDNEHKNVMAHSDNFESLDSVRFAVCQAIAGIDGVTERMRLYCDGIMCVDFELPTGGRIDLANYSCAYIKGYTDCVCDDDEGDTQEAQDNDLASKYNDLASKYNELACKYNELASKYNAIATSPVIITASEPKETKIPRKLFI